MARFPVTLTASIRRRLQQDSAGEVFLELFDLAQAHDHLLGVKLLETLSTPERMVMVSTAMDDVLGLCQAAGLAAQASTLEDRQEAESLREEHLDVINVEDDLTWLVCHFLLIDVWDAVIDQWASDPQWQVRDEIVFKACAKAWMKPIQSRLRQVGPRRGHLFLRSAQADDRLRVPVLGQYTVGALQVALARALIPAALKCRGRGQRGRARRSVQQRAVGAQRRRPKTIDVRRHVGGKAPHRAMPWRRVT